MELIKKNIQSSNAQRTEEIADIIERMPNVFAKRITLLVCLIVGLLLFFGFIVKYPDVVVGEVSIAAEQAPIELVNEQNGVLKLNRIKSQDVIQAGSLLAWIDNPVNPETIDSVKNLIINITSPTTNARFLYNRLPKSLNLGDLTVPYASFLSSVKQLGDYQDNHLFDKEENTFSQVLTEQESALRTLKEKEELNYQTFKISKKFLERDSILLAKRVVSQAEFDNTLSKKLMAEDQVKSSIRNSSSLREQISNTKNSIQQIRIAKSEKEMQLNLDVVTSFNNLVDKIKVWEKQYLIKSPITGKVQFLKFWNNNQFIRNGEPIFSIIPNKSKIYGEVALPISGAGKVKKGQHVIVKLADFPYMEYGYIQGVVHDISLVSSSVQMENGKTIDSYLITINFPRGMITNYGSKLAYKLGTKGSAEIITQERKLIERFFDNLKYIKEPNNN